MHVILGILGTIVTILILVNRLSEAGIDIGWLDPFKWNRRRSWKQAYHSNPVFDIDDPMKSTAGLMYTMAKCSGDISREEKACILSIFKDIFKLSDREATDLLSTCSFYIKDENTVKNNLTKYLDPSINNFAEEQKHSAFSIVERVAFCEGKPNEKQTELLGQIRNILMPEKAKYKEW
jgi:uncharacterized tellurite resistance protein B-like protein